MAFSVCLYSRVVLLATTSIPTQAIITQLTSWSKVWLLIKYRLSSVCLFFVFFLTRSCSECNAKSISCKYACLQGKMTWLHYCQFVQMLIRSFLAWEAAAVGEQLTLQYYQYHHSDTNSTNNNNNTYFTFFLLRPFLLFFALFSVVNFTRSSPISWEKWEELVIVDWYWYYFYLLSFLFHCQSSLYLFLMVLCI